MRIIVFGATGGIGRLLVEKAIEQAHTVTAFVRDPAQLQPRTGLRVVAGDALDTEAVADAMNGQRAVLSALGARSLKLESLLANALPNILHGMRQHYIERIIVLGAAGAVPGAGKYQTPLSNLLFAVVKRTLLRHPMADQAAQERLLADSEMDYTIVRPPRLTDGPATGNYCVLPDSMPSSSRHISRADVADFMLQQLNDPRFHHRGVYLAADGPSSGRR
ncbi:MAG: NAD(P)-dependent oxidoreductase [Acidobacteriaceae bacterium]